ncbi:4-coumarate--CoA ligase [Methylibium sp.]|uniref:4-coumarate--CoA ligase n=1 Tax=Methylibium sp. TaxID=2067992 RepID=UPI0017BCFD01|nr:4-coumarate--CoA ligase [Methylibium sp.]MBA3590283.1 4-coumarate--CoA ligase [Methylibium sp.]
MTTPTNTAGAWHEQPGALSRFVGDLIAGEVAHLRPGGAALAARPWPHDLSLDEDGLGLDSLERLSVASALNEALHLHESGIEDLLLARRRFGEWLEIAHTGLRQSDARLSFRTSGSSGTPKACAHALATLEQEADCLGMMLGGARRLLVAVPAHHIYGFLFTVLLPSRLGVADVIDVRRTTPQALQHMMSAGDLVISHPAHWSLMAKHASTIPAGVVGVTSTAPCDDALARSLEKHGLQRLLQVYGSSETAGVGWREQAGAPYCLLPFWSFDQADGSRLLRATPQGSVHAHDLQDRLEWLADGRFNLRSRRDEAVQVGGINVFPARIRQLLLEHPEVADAAVRLMSAGEGSRLKAFVVPASGTDREALRSDLERATQTRLSAVERPKAWAFGDSLPVNDQGKLCDWPLATNAAGAMRT